MSLLSTFTAITEKIIGNCLTITKQRYLHRPIICNSMLANRLPLPNERFSCALKPTRRCVIALILPMHLFQNIHPPCRLFIYKMPKEQILIIAKTYPTPSVKYDELVCTAGMRKDGTWVRLYAPPVC